MKQSFPPGLSPGTRDGHHRHLLRRGDHQLPLQASDTQGATPLWSYRLASSTAWASSASSWGSPGSSRTSQSRVEQQTQSHVHGLCCHLRLCRLRHTWILSTPHHKSMQASAQLKEVWARSCSSSSFSSRKTSSMSSSCPQQETASISSWSHTHTHTHTHEPHKDL